MQNACFSHTDTPSVGFCMRCRRPACLLCIVEVGADLFCSPQCEVAHRTSGADPLAGVDFTKEPSRPALSEVSDPSILMKAMQASPDGSGTSILEMSPVLKPEPSVVLAPDAALPEWDDSSSGNLGIMKPPSSVQVPEAEPPMPILVPGTRRATIDRNCVRHGDTPAIVRCSRCVSPICSMCAEEAPEGMVCGFACPGKSGEVRAARRKSVWVGMAAGALALVVAGIVFYPTEKPPVAAPPVAPVPVEIARAKTPPPLPPEPVKVVVPEPPKSDPPKVEVPKPTPPKVEPPKPVDPPKGEVPKPAPPKVEPPKPVEPPKVEVPKPAPPEVEPPKPVEPPKVEVPKPAPPKVEPPKPIIVAKVDPPKPVDPPRLAPAVRAMVDAAALIREAAPLFQQVGDGAEPTPDLEGRLSKARALYVQFQAEAPDPAAITRRIAVLSELLEALRLPTALERGSKLVREATPLYRAAADGVAGAADRAREKLKEARAIYADLQAEAPNPKWMASRVETIDGLLEALGDRR